MIDIRAVNDKFPLLTKAGRDHKAWAKRIKYREQLKDDTLTAIQVRFANEALEVKEDGNL